MNIGGQLPGFYDSPPPLPDPVPPASSGGAGSGSAYRPSAGSGSSSPRPQPPQDAINFNLVLIFATTDVLQNVEGISVPPQATVRIRAHNNKDTGNTKTVRVALSRELLETGRGTPIDPNVEITYPVSNTAHIWASGQAGDGIIVTVSANATA